MSSHGGMPPIHFDLIDDSTLNAGAFRYKEEYFIFINTGTIGLLALFFIRVLADRRFFREIGRPDVERETLPSFGTLVADAIKMKSAFKSVEAPLDQIRIDFSHGLIMRAFSFLLAHELTHVFDGHLDFLTQRGSSYYAEFNNVGSFDVMERQALELDADHGAACAEIGQLLRKVADDPKDDPSLSDSRLLNPRYALFMWFFSIHTVFWFFGDTRFTPADLARGPYPPPRLRQWWTRETAERQLATRSKRPDLAPMCRTISNSALLLVEETFSTLTDGVKSIEGIADAEMHGSGYASERYWYWKNILRPKLLPFALTPLPE